MQSVVVSTKEELKAAVDRNTREIIVVGKLASDLKRAKKVATLGKVALAGLVAVVGLVPFTGGLSGLAGIGLVALTGVEISTIIIASAIGISLVLAVHKGYDVEYGPDGRMILKKPQNNS